MKKIKLVVSGSGTRYPVQIGVIRVIRKRHAELKGEKKA